MLLELPLLHWPLLLLRLLRLPRLLRLLGLLGLLGLLILLRLFCPGLKIKPKLLPAAAAPACPAVPAPAPSSIWRLFRGWAWCEL